MININQHNYEEFFLLYVDGELSAADKQAVERFVQENPDLAVELDILQQSQLPVEDWGFGNKDQLYRSESAEINSSNCQEQFLLYVDNELDAADREKVERFVLQHPSLQESFTQLKRTKLEPELLAFPDKTSLYRREERRILYMSWQRIAVAAVLTGLALLLWTVVPQQKNHEPMLAKQSGKEASRNTQQPVTQPATGNIAETQMDQGNQAAVTRTETPVTVTNVIQQTDPGIRPTDLLAVNTESARTNGIQRTDADVITTGANNGPGSITSPVTHGISGDNAVLDNVDMVRPTGLQHSDTDETENIRPAVYRELDTESADQKKSLLLGSLEINKDKLRGFFRKAGSIFRSKSKTEEEPVTTNTRSSE